MKRVHYPMPTSEFENINIEELEQFANIRGELRYGFDITSCELGISELMDSFNIEKDIY